MIMEILVLGAVAGGGGLSLCPPKALSKEDRGTGTEGGNSWKPSSKGTRWEQLDNKREVVEQWQDI